MGIDVNPIYEEYKRKKNYNVNDFVVPEEKLSVILITKNEEKNIARCLNSVTFADEIIIVDSGSTDKTCEIAKQFNNVKVIHSEWLGFVDNKKIAISHAQYDWIFWIDADEECPVELANEWNLIKKNPFFHEAAAIDIGRKTFFLTHWVKHSGWYPNRIIRFFNKNRAQFSANILHESIQTQPGFVLEHFKTDLLHYSYTSLFQYFYKMNVYGISGAKEIIRRKKTVFIPQLFFQPIWTFFKFYILKKGFLDGRIGLIICMGAAFSNFIKYANYFYLKKYGRVEC